MSLLDSIFETHLPHRQPDQWISSRPLVVRSSENGQTVWIVVHNISSIHETHDNLVIKMAGGETYGFPHPKARKQIREILTTLGMIT